MKIKINYKIIIFILFFCLTNQINLYILFMLFAGIHELGHIITAICLKLKIRKLEILPTGFCIALKIDTKNYNKKILRGSLLTIKKLIISIAGPTVNIIFIFIFLLIKKDSIFMQNIDTLIYINILIFIFNMLPIYPLDGGRILKYTLCIFFKKSLVLQIVNITSNIICIILSIFSIIMGIMFFNFSYFVIVVYLWILVIKENKIYKLKRKMYKILENNIAINQD